MAIDARTPDEDLEASLIRSRTLRVDRKMPLLSRGPRYVDDSGMESASGAEAADATELGWGRGGRVGNAPEGGLGERTQAGEHHTYGTY